MKRINPDYADYSLYVGKRLRIKNTVDTFEGEMCGLAPNTIVATGPTTTLSPWLLRRNDGTTVAFIPSAWEVFDLAAGLWREQ